MAETQNYSNMAIRLHWLIALLIVGNIIGGFIHEAFDEATMAVIMGLHKSTGILILALSLFRLYWRLTHRAPRSVAGLKGWEIGLSHLTHWGFYVLMIVVPLSGWWMSSAAEKRWPLDFFGLFPIPYLPVEQGKAAAGFWHEAHEITAFLMIGLLVLHVLGALKHQFDGNPVMHRMLPWMRAA